MEIYNQSTKNNTWFCKGGLDNATFGEPTLEGALDRQHCAGGTMAAGGPALEGVQWDAYRCGHGPRAGDYDVAKRYGLITARRSYMCPLLGGDSCTTIYDGQDRR